MEREYSDMETWAANIDVDFSRRPLVLIEEQSIASMVWNCKIIGWEQSPEGVLNPTMRGSRSDIVKTRMQVK